jgi:hypothetical protein
MSQAGIHAAGIRNTKNGNAMQISNQYSVLRTDCLSFRTPHSEFRILPRFAIRIAG